MNNLGVGMNIDLSKAIRKPMVWGPLLGAVVVFGAVQARIFMDGLDQAAEVGGEQQVEDPVYYPPQRVEPAAVVIKSAPVSNEVVFDSELLQRARAYRLAKIQAMEDEISKKSEPPLSYDGQLSSGLQAPPAPPSGTPVEDVPANPLSVSMVVMGTMPKVWLSKGGDTQSGVVGDSVFGKRITSISPDRVCFSDKSCLKVN